ncbi:glycoside hydrolase 15 protein, partial [Quaeritorhiza haematococci]
APTEAEASKYEKLIWDYATLSVRHQTERGCEPFIQGTCEALGGPGEVKYMPDGSLFKGPWGRFQNDGPALRASTLIRFYNAFVKRGGDPKVAQEKLWGSASNPGVIKVDLDYVVKMWPNSGFDLWEEVPAQHFFTRMVQRRALIEGSVFAASLGDTTSSQTYKSQADSLSSVIDRHWDSSNKYIREMIDTPNWYNRAGRNIATVLAVIHGYNGDGFYSPVNERILASVDKLRADFEREYSISGIRNDQAGLALGTPFGRYKEDVYDGTQGNNNGNTRGHPWFLATLAVAEHHYLAAQEYLKTGSITVTDISLPFFQSIKANNLSAGQTYPKTSPQFSTIINALTRTADEYVRRTKFHVGPSGRMAEQFSRDNGFQLSAEDLTWSYASVLTMNFARRKLSQ